MALENVTDLQIKKKKKSKKRKYDYIDSSEDIQEKQIENIDQSRKECNISNNESLSKKKKKDRKEVYIMDAERKRTDVDQELFINEDKTIETSFKEHRKKKKKHSKDKISDETANIESSIEKLENYNKQKQNKSFQTPKKNKHKENFENILSINVESSSEKLESDNKQKQNRLFKTHKKNKHNEDFENKLSINNVESSSEKLESDNKQKQNKSFKKPKKNKHNEDFENNLSINNVENAEKKLNKSITVEKKNDKHKIMCTEQSRNIANLVLDNKKSNHRHRKKSKTHNEKEVILNGSVNSNENNTNSNLLQDIIESNDIKDTKKKKKHKKKDKNKENNLNCNVEENQNMIMSEDKLETLNKDKKIKSKHKKKKNKKSKVTEKEHFQEIKEKADSDINHNKFEHANSNDLSKRQIPNEITADTEISNDNDILQESIKNSNNVEIISDDDEEDDLFESEIYNFDEEEINFEPPLLHAKGLPRLLTKQQRDVMASLGVEIRLGKWSKKEDAILIRNWNDFIQKHKLSEPHILLGLSRYKNPIITKFVRAKKFYFLLGKGLNNRTLHSCYLRARKLFHPNKTERKCTKEELSEIKRLVTIYGNKWTKFGSRMKLEPRSVSEVARWHRKNAVKGIWSEEEEENLIEAIKTVLKIKDVAGIYYGIEWEKVSRLVPTRNGKQCRSHWLLETCWRMSNNIAKEKWRDEDNIRLIYYMYRLPVEDEVDTDWIDLHSHFQNVSTYSVLRTRWWKLKRKVPDYENRDFEDIVSYLYHIYLPALLKKIGRAYIEEILETP